MHLPKIFCLTTLHWRDDDGLLFSEHESATFRDCFGRLAATRTASNGRRSIGRCLLKLLGQMLNDKRRGKFVLSYLLKKCCRRKEMAVSVITCFTALSSAQLSSDIYWAELRCTPGLSAESGCMAAWAVCDVWLALLGSSQWLGWLVCFPFATYCAESSSHFMGYFAIKSRWQC